MRVMMKNDSLYDRIRRQAEQTPDNIAAVAAGSVVTYRELLEKAGKYTHYLRRGEQESGGIVCILMERTIDMLACTIGVLGAGKAYMHLNPAMPREQLTELLEMLHSPLIVDRKYQSALTYQGMIPVGAVMDSAGEASPLDEVKRDTAELAYLVYTTGTSGKQKIIMVEDQSIIRYIDAFTDLFHITAADRSLQQSPCYYDGFAEEVFSMLFNGGAVVLAEDNILANPRLIKRTVEENRVTVMATTPLMLSAINAVCGHIDSLRCLISSGDVLKARQYDNLIRHTKIYNMYGPSETTVCATCYECSAADSGAVPIGKPITGYRLLVCDASGGEVPDGTKGEIYIGGGAARGYWADSRATAQAFVEINGERMYKTGDFGVKRSDGNFEYRGRIDQQIKIHGRIVHLSDIEKTLLSCPLVQEVAVIARERHDDRELTAFYLSPAGDISRDLLAFAREKLADYMVPAGFIHLESFPLTATGKLDKAALLKLDHSPGGENCPDIGAGEPRFQECLTRIADYLFGEHGIERISKESALADLGIKSLAFISLAVFSESTFHFVFEDDKLDYRAFPTLGDLCDYICSRQPE